MTHDDGVYLAHIRECIALAREFTSGGRAAFDVSPLVQFATTRALQVMAESTQRLSDAFKAQHPEVPWRQIAGFRNVLVHGYMQINLDVVWNAVTDSLPALDAAAHEQATPGADDARS